MDHWAFMLVRKGEWLPVIFDGLQQRAIMEAAVTFCTWLEEKFNLDARPQPVWSVSYKQRDAWSCGHRIMSSWRHLLTCRSGNLLYLMYRCTVHVVRVCASEDDQPAREAV